MERYEMTFKYLKPFMLVIIFAGFSITVMEVATAMWETNKSAVVIVGIIFATYWVDLLMDYLNDRNIFKNIDKVQQTK